MWDSSNRPEQKFVVDYLKTLFPDWKIQTEYRINDLKIDGKPYRNCILDIAILNKKIAIRLNGGYHRVSGRQGTKDAFQMIALEQMGWRVVDFDDHQMPNLFKKKKNDTTIKLAKDEINLELSWLSV